MGEIEQRPLSARERKAIATFDAIERLSRTYTLKMMAAGNAPFTLHIEGDVTPRTLRSICVLLEANAAILETTND